VTNARGALGLRRYGEPIEGVGALLSASALTLRVRLRRSYIAPLESAAALPVLRALSIFGLLLH